MVLIEPTGLFTLHLQIDAEVNKLEEEGRGTAALTDELSDDMKVPQLSLPSTIFKYSLSEL